MPFALLGCALALGCAVGPDYVRPETEMPLPDEWNNEIAEEMGVALGRTASSVYRYASSRSGSRR